MAEIVANEDLLINPNDVYSLNEKISYFLNSDSSEIVAQNFQRAQHFSQEIFANNVLKIYNEL